MDVLEMGEMGSSQVLGKKVVFKLCFLLSYLHVCWQYPFQIKCFED